VESCFDHVTFCLPAAYTDKFYKGKSLSYIYERFFNADVECVASAKYMGDYEARYMTEVSGKCAVILERELEPNFYVGLLGMLQPRDELNVSMKLFVRCHKRFIIFNEPREVLRQCDSSLETQCEQNGNRLYIGGVVGTIKKPQTNWGHFIVLHQLEDFDGPYNTFDYCLGPRRVVFSERMWDLFVTYAQRGSERDLVDMTDIIALINSLLRSIIYQTRTHIAADCTGCVRNNVDDTFKCSYRDDDSIIAVMHIYLRRMINAETNRCRRQVLENISGLFKEVASRLREEMRGEEKAIHHFRRGVPALIQIGGSFPIPASIAFPRPDEF
jgi:hypothetical protein